MSSRDEDRLFDVRTLERNLRKGLVTKKDLEKHIKGLPDAADKATACNPEAQGREPSPPPSSHRAVVIATPPSASLDDDDMLDEDGALLDDDEGDDEDDDEDDEDAADGDDEA